MVNKDFFAALADLEKEKGISEAVMLETLQNALASAYKKQYEGETGLVEVRLDPEKSTMRFFIHRLVVESALEKKSESDITVEEAQEICKREGKRLPKIGEELVIEIVPKDFGRIAAQTAKQVILQKIHETERDNNLTEFSDREGEMLSGVVRRVDENGIHVEIGKAQFEGLMLPHDQVPGEKLRVGERIKVFVRRVKSSGRSAQVLVSRAAPGLVKRLFEEQVPEIRQGAIEIKAIAREAGHRSKIAIYANDPQIDPVGACVGTRGSRVNAVVQELGGEKIDIIVWSENPLEFIAKALAPATVLSVTQIGERSAIACVPDDKLSLAIGKDGQNARLAARLTGWKIDVKSESVFEAQRREMELSGEYDEEAEEEPEDNENGEEGSGEEA